MIGNLFRVTYPRPPSKLAPAALAIYADDVKFKVKFLDLRLYRLTVILLFFLRGKMTRSKATHSVRSVRSNEAVRMHQYRLHFSITI